MSPYDDDALEKLLRQVARKKGFAPLSPEQAQAEYDAAARERLSKEEIDRIVRNVVAGKPRRGFKPTPSSHAEESCAVNDEMLVLNRSAGDLDPEAARKIEELRRDALADDDDNGEEDEPRLDD
jgi:hypothetical protein